MYDLILSSESDDLSINEFTHWGPKDFQWDHVYSIFGFGKLLQVQASHKVSVCVAA